MAAPTIPLYTGVTPNRTQSPNDFADNADDWLNYQSPLASDYNNLATYLDNLAVDVDADAAAAAQSVIDASGFADDAQNSANLAASSANFKGTWSSLSGALNKPASVLHNGTYWQLLNDLVDVTLSEPSVTGDWASIPQPLKVAPRTAAAALTVELPNELQDGSTFPLPLANSVPAETSIEIEQPRTFKAFKPFVERSGSDLISDENGTDTILSFVNPTKIKLTSNGVDTWRL